MQFNQPVYENPSPGNDLVVALDISASGCQMVLFTTGRGTPFGSFVPTMKISTNNEKNNFRELAIFKNGVTL